MTTPNFNRVARIYRFAEYAALGPLLQRVRTHFIPGITQTRNALVLGDGDGRFLRAFLQANTTTQVTAIDASSTMLSLLRHNTAFAATRVRTEQASLENYTPIAEHDLIVTHFVLDCLDQPTVNSLVERIGQQSADTQWLVSDFGLPHNAVARTAARLYIRTLYLAFRILTGLRVQQLPDHIAALRSAGFTLTARKEWLGGFLFTELWTRSETPPAGSASD